MRLVLLLAAAATTSLAAQSSVPADLTLHGTPGGAAIATLPKGAPIRTGATRSGWTLVTIEGWIASTRLASRRDTLDRTVTGTPTAPLRALDGPRQPVVATLEPGTLLKSLAERNGWTRVRRSGWVRSAALAAGTAPARTSPAVTQPAETKGPPAAPRQAEAVPPARPAPASGGGVAERAVRATTIFSAPGGAERATLNQGSVVETLARDRGWVRVRLDGWVPEGDLAVADSASAAALSAADLRADPERYRGAIVRWEMEVIAFQRADALRKGMTPNEPYLLLRGPGSEAAMVYAAIPAAMTDEARSLTPMSVIIVTARVRDGRSVPVGVPILDVLSLAPAR